MAYNLTGLDTGNTFYDYTNTINTALGGNFAILLIFGLWLILMISFKNYETKIGMLASSTIISVITALTIGLGFVNMSIIFFPVALMLVSLMWVGLSR